MDIDRRIHSKATKTVKKKTGGKQIVAADTAHYRVANKDTKKHGVAGDPIDSSSTEINKVQGESHSSMILDLPRKKSQTNQDDTNNKVRPGAQEERIRVHKHRKYSWADISFLVLGCLGFIGGLACVLIAIMQPEQERTSLEFPMIPSQNVSENTYSSLTGEPLADGASKNAPTYCVQTPNGTDGARPQVGLTQAGVIFEAIAEAGITRFAAIYQNPTSAVIGPIRSLRLYYLDWDTPFDCTIVHAGGADDALRAVANGGYKDLSEDYSYMYRGTYGQRLWNNLFTTPSNLQKFSESHGYNESEIHGFARMTPDESFRSLVDDLSEDKLDITRPALGRTSELVAKTSDINLNFGGSATFNVNYVYDIDSNTYLRSYRTGQKHEVYKCPDENLGEKNPEDVCELTQIAPSVVIAMVVSERRAADNYHENITTTGSGKVYIFQNGDVIEGTWSKPTKNDQIKFADNDNHEIKLAPGQTFISAIPSYGSIEY